MKIYLPFQAMAQDDILQHVPANVYEKIKAQDSNPLFAAYVVGEEGDAHGRLIGVGTVITKWLRSAISGLVQKLQFGTKFFRWHNKDNSTEGRKAVGEVVGKALEEVNGKQRALAVAYIYPEARDFKLDACSIEADIIPNRIMGDVNIRQITAIALGDSSMVRPAFENAGLVAQLQGFAFQGGDMDAKEVKRLVRDLGLAPSEIFTWDDLDTDVEFKNKIAMRLDKLVSKRVKEEAEELKGKLDAQKTDYEKLKVETAAKLQESEGKAKTFQMEILKGKAGSRIDAVVKERKLTPAQEKFVNIARDKFTPPETEADLDKNVNTFLDDQVKEFDKMQTIFKDPGIIPHPSNIPPVLV